MKDKTSIIGLKNEIYLNDEFLPTQNIDIIMISIRENEKNLILFNQISNKKFWILSDIGFTIRFLYSNL